jgi:hypothetical protein
MNPALIAALPSLLQGGMGIYQMIQGQNMTNQDRPQYKTPGQVLGNQVLASQEYSTGSRMASEMQNRGDAAAANQANTALNSGMGAGAAPAILAQMNDNSRQSVLAGEQKRMADLVRLMTANQGVAQGKDMEFQMNQFAPYAQRYNEGREMFGAGSVNTMNGVSGLSSLAQIYMAGQETPTPSAAAGLSSNSVTSRATDGDAIRNIANTVRANQDYIQYMNSMYPIRTRPQ